MLELGFFLQIVGGCFMVFLLGKYLHAFYQRMIVPAKQPLQYGKWGIVTGSTSGIGKDFAEYLAKKGMSVVLISRTEDKLIEQKKELEGKYDVSVKYLAYDFTDMGPARETFYAKLHELCGVMHKDGGIGLLINNVGTVHYHPKLLLEITDQEVDSMLNCNMNSVVYMSRAVLPHMLQRKNGCVVSISSGSCYTPNPFIGIYAATK
jgi:17beta-estradiol 17-dehydrogenase / very-long-chain 3-oxoacyl-CoA reductase